MITLRLYLEYGELMGKLTEVIILHVEPTFKEKLKIVAQEADRSLSQYIRVTLRQALAQGIK